MKQIRVWGVAVSLLAAVAGTSPAAFLGWQYKAKITFQGYSSRPETLTNFTLLVRLGTNILTNFAYSQSLSANGADLRFAASNDVDELRYEMEEWKTNGVSTVWVQVPRLAGPTDFIYAYWGRSGQSFPTYCTNGTVWSNDYRAVWHLKEDQSGTGTIGLYRDSTTNKADFGAAYYAGQQTGRRYHWNDYVSSSGKGGIAGPGQQFDGADDYIGIPSGSDYTKKVCLPGGYTLIAWVKTTSTKSAPANVVDTALNVLGEWGNDCYEGFGVQNGVVRLTLYTGAGVNGVSAVNDGNWHQIAATHATAGAAQVFADGRRENTGSFSYQTTYNGYNVLGRGHAGDYFDGSIDEVRIAGRVLSTNWIWTTWANVANNTTFNNYGPATSTGGKPVIANAAPVVNSRTSATLRGYLSDTGGTVVTVSVYWGTADGGAPTSGQWQATNTFAVGRWATGSYPATNVALNATNVFYFYRFFAANGGGDHWPETSASFLGGDVWATAPDAAASEVGPDAGRFTIQRHPDATNGAITIPYSFAGAAVRQVDYTLRPAPLSVTLPAGVASTNIILTPLQDGLPSEGSERATLVLGTGLYAVGSPASNSIDIADGPAVSVSNLTVAAGSWSDDLVWSLGRAPVAGDNVLVRHAVTLGSSSPLLATFGITNATMTFTNWTTTLYASNVAVRGGGTLTHAVCDTAAAPGNSNRVHVVCTNLAVEAGGAINVDHKGYVPGQGPGTPAGVSQGYSGGAGYGGSGCRGYYVAAAGGPSYGSVTAPIAPGSGAGNLGFSGADVISGNGGGAVRLEVNGTLTVDGTIRANGKSGLYNYHGGGGGSGGAIYITCRTFQGSGGLLAANGANSSWYLSSYFYSGAGGGGRIAVHYAGLGAAHDVRFSTAAGTGICDTVKGYLKTEADSREQYRPQPGTVWLPDTGLLGPVLNNGRFFNVRLYGPSTWAVDSLTVENCSVTFAQDGFVLRVTNDVTVGAGGQLGIGWLNGAAKPALYCGQDLTLTGGGLLSVYAGETNGTAGDYGALVSVTGDVVIAASSWLRPYAHEAAGGVPLLRMENLSIASGGGINAIARGYRPGFGPGKGQLSPTAGDYCGGSGHGGKGGRTYYGNGLGGRTYGSVTKPTAPGSASDGSTASYFSRPMNGKGGGGVWIEARGTATVLGTLAADGGNGDHNGYSNQGAGGAGGSVYVKCSAWSGSGLLSAKGGDSSDYASDYYSGGGGGGRIAMDYATAAGTPRFATAGGKGIANRAGNSWDSWRPYAARAGTLYLPDDTFLSTVLSGGQFQDVCLTLDVSSVTRSSLTVSNCSVAFSGDGARLTVNGNILIGANGSLGIGAAPGDAAGTGYVLRCTGSMVVTNGGALHVYGGRTNGTGRGYGTLVDVTGSIVVAPSSWVYAYSHEYDGGSPLFRVGSLMIPSTSSGINANGRGYAVTNGPGKGIGGWGSCVSYGPGGGYGGRGGNDVYYYVGGGVYDIRGGTYGSSNAPVEPGSGSGSWNGGYGGGLVRIEAGGTILVNGTISANGGSCAQMDNNLGGGGSGGGIYLRCLKIAGSAAGKIAADGGNGGSTYSYCGPGGGGRIAAYFWRDLFAGPKTAAKGAYDYVPSGQLAEPGTIVWRNVSKRGTLVVLL